MLKSNPFFILGATSRDDRRRISDLAETATLTQDEDVIREARTSLTHPRKRLSAELGWLPGLGPKQVSEALRVVDETPIGVRSQQGLPTLAKANLLASGMEAVGVEAHLSVDDFSAWIVDLARAYEDLDAESIFEMINEDRAVANFPLVSDPHLVDEILNRECLDSYRESIVGALDRIFSKARRVDVVTAVADKISEKPLVLVDRLIENYEINSQEFLENEKENISNLVDRIGALMQKKNKEKSIQPLITKLESVVKNWDRVAQPIQLNHRARGIEHPLSVDIARRIRVLAVYLSNEHGLFDISKRLTMLQQLVFAELDALVEQLDEDKKILTEMIEARAVMRREMERRQANSNLVWIVIAVLVVLMGLVAPLLD